MNEERVPGSSPEDQELDRRWRSRSVEEPSSSTDMRIRAAAREAIQTSASHAARATHRTRRWTRFAPLAAAASIALLAVGLVRLIPREEYQAVPTPKLAHPDEAPEPATAAPPERESAAADAEHALSEPLQAPRSEPPPVSASRDALAYPTERARHTRFNAAARCTARTRRRGRRRRGTACHRARGSILKEPGSDRASSEGQRSAAAKHGDHYYRSGVSRAAPARIDGVPCREPGSPHGAGSPGAERRGDAHGPRLRLDPHPRRRSGRVAGRVAGV